MRKPESGRPQVVAHRGASAAFPEHTEAAYVEALAQGAEAFEFDVRLTLDDELVCIHDAAVTRTSNGTGTVGELTLAQLQHYDFGSWHHGEPATILTARRVLELARDAGRPIDLAIETKHPQPQGHRVEARLVELLAEFGWAGADSPARIMSFHPTAIRRVRRLAPDLEVVFLIEKPWVARIARLFPRDWIYGPGIGIIRKNHDIARWFVDHGRRVHVWTPNTPGSWDLLCDLGVEAIITDKPGEALAHLAGAEGRFAG